MNRFAFPAVARPEVSVLLPVHGWGDFLGTTLERLLASTDPVYEVIVVDDASPDGAGERLERTLSGARLVRNAKNLGFGHAVMQAAALARAPYLLLLNSDVFVTPGWLPPLIDRIAGPRTGAVSPVLLEPDGRVQEAGSIVFRNGYTQFAGVGADPEDPAFRFPRTADYASAACLLVRRDAFFAAGGFDPVYAPAYYEDVELCLSLRRLGWTTAVDPRSRVIHLRGASTGDALAAASFLRNVAIFEKRWRKLLAARPEATPAGPAGSARRRLAGRDAPAHTRILLLASAAGAKSAARLATELARDPGARVALAPAPRDPETLLLAGVEVPGAVSLEAWLEERAFHFDVALLCGAPGAKERALLSRTQPQAARIPGDDAASLAAALAACGVPVEAGPDGYHPPPPSA